MKRKLLIAFLFCGVSAGLTGQIKIGDNPQNIDAASVLELESTNRVLVITRVNSVQMNAIVPNPGAMVYNTDEQCIFYYDGSTWQNLCSGQGLVLTADPIVNSYPTIAITANGDQRNIEVTEIRGENITDSTITGIDILNESISEVDLQSDSVGSDELQSSSVSDDEIDYSQVTLGDFINDVGYITSATIISADTGNNITAGTDGGAYFSALGLETAIQANADAIAADLDGDPTNELQAITSPDASVTVTQVGNDYELTVPGGGGNPTDELNTAFAVNGGFLEITDPGNTFQVALTDISTDDQEAFEVPYDNATSGLVATDTQAAIDEIVATSVAPHNGGTGAVYFADATGAPITNDDSFYWDETARFNSGALYIGVDSNVPSTRAKVHIMEDIDTQLAYPLQLQNDSNLDTGGAAVGLLFSVEGTGNFGKGAIAYERMDTFGRGDFHFLQESSAASTDAELVNAVMTIKNSGDVGIGTTVPNSTLELAGSFAAPIRSAAAGAVNADDHTVIFTSIGTITLPPVGSCAGRIYVLKNTGGGNSTIDSYLDNSGNPTTTLPPGVTWLQSDGINWHQVN